MSMTEPIKPAIIDDDGSNSTHPMTSILDAVANSTNNPDEQIAMALLAAVMIAKCYDISLQELEQTLAAAWQVPTIPYQ